MSARRLAVLIRGIPADDHGWTAETELAAQAVDVMSRLVHVTLAAHSDEKGRRKLGDPPRVPRPWDPPPPPKLTAAGKIRAFARSLTGGGD